MPHRPRSPSVEQLFSRGMRHQRNGKLAEAKALYRACLARLPDHPYATLNLGNVCLALKENEQAIGYFRRATTLLPDDFHVHRLFGDVLLVTGDPAGAVMAYRKTLKIRRDDCELHMNLGTSLQTLGRTVEAHACFNRAIACGPHMAEPYFNLGNLLKSTGRPGAAANEYRRALTLRHDYVEARLNLGTVMEALGQVEAAILFYSQVLVQRPGYGKAQLNQGTALKSAGRLDAAERSCRLALRLQPDLAAAHNNLGTLQRDSARGDEAVVSYRRSLVLNPEFPETYNNLGLALLDQSEFNLSMRAFHRSLRIKPDYAQAYDNLLFALNYHPDLSEREIFDAHRNYESSFCEALRPPRTEYKNNRDSARRLRVGYVSPDFCQHPMANFLEPLLANHDRKNVEIFAYAEIAHEDKLTERYRSYVDHWITTNGMPDAELDRRIRADEIDILVDLAGHTAHNRLSLFARKPAPVSLSWMGYGYSTGLSSIDYFLTDSVMAPSGSESLFAEVPWRLGSNYVYRPATPMGEVSSLPALEAGYLTFGSLTRSPRINHRTIGVWAEILKRIANSRLVVDSKSFQSPFMRAWLRDKFAALGVAPERIEPGCHSPPWNVLRQIDITLDCFPQNCGTTLFESLYMGIPFVTLADRISVGRMGSSILTGLGHPEWIARTEEDYVAKVTDLAADLKNLADLRQRLRSEMHASMLMDEAGFARQVEQAYRQMFALWADSKGTTTIAGGVISLREQEKLLTDLYLQGNDAEAEALARIVLSDCPDNPFAWKILGAVLHRQGKADAALEAMQTGVRCSQADAEQYYHLATLLNQRRRHAEAKENCHQALILQRDYAEAHYGLGNALIGLSDREGGIKSYLRATILNPAYAEAYCHLGNSLKSRGQRLRARDCYAKALRIRADYAEAYFNLGNEFKEGGRLTDAEINYKRALVLAPGFCEAHHNLGVSFQDRRLLDDAERSYLRTLNIKPDHVEAFYNFGCTLRECGRSEEAEASYRRALAAQPNHALSRLALAMLSLPISPATIQESLEAPEKFDLALTELASWLNSSIDNRIPFSRAAGLQQPFFLAYRDGNHKERLAGWGNMVTGESGNAVLTRTAGRPRIRLGIVSQFFRRHSVWDIIIRGLLSHIDKSKFELILYYLGHTEDTETTYARHLADVWHDALNVRGLEGWLGTVSADAPDVLFYPEIAMDQMTFDLATHRLAPLQVASWGHPITTGLPTIDMYFSGDLIEPEGAEAHYRERLIRLPGTGCCTRPIEIISEPLPDLAEKLGLRRGPVFLCGQVSIKFDPSHDALYADIASRVGASTFVFLNDPKYPWATDRLMARLDRTFAARGMDSKCHLLLLPWLPREKFFGLLDLCDIFLDCPSFSGYTTAWQATHYGLPIVTLEGKFMRQRLAAGLLRKLGITDTIAGSSKEYVGIAAQLAEECDDAARRNRRRQCLKSAVSRLDNDIGVVRAFEQTVISALH